MLPVVSLPYWLAFLLGCFGASFLVMLAIAIGRKLLERPNLAARGLFVYSDGKSERSIDPITAMMGLKAHPKFVLERHLRLAYDGDPEGLELTAQAAYSVFGVEPFTVPGKPGLTMRECYRLIWSFVNYCDSLKKNTSPLPTAPTATESTCSHSSATTPSDTPPSGSALTEPSRETVSQS